MSQNQSSPSLSSSKLAITIPYDHLRTLMLEYVEEANRAEAGKYHHSLELERQLTLSGFLVWLRNRQKEGQ